MSVHSSIQGQMLDITVVGCNKLKNTELFSRQDPYVCFQYGSTNYRTRTCTDGGKNPKFSDKFQITLIEGLREINVSVWNSNTLTGDDFIGSGRIQLGKVLKEGFHDGVWQLQTKSSRYAGDLKLIMYFPKALLQRCQSAPAQFSYPTCSSPPSPAPYPFCLPTPTHYSGSVCPPAYPPPPQTCQATAYPSQQPYPPPPPPPPPQIYQPTSYPPQQPYPPPPPPETYQLPAYPPQQPYPPPPPPQTYQPTTYPPQQPYPPPPPPQTYQPTAYPSQQQYPWPYPPQQNYPPPR